MGALIDKTYKGCGHSHATAWDKLKVYWQNLTKLNANIKNPNIVYTEVDELKDNEISKELFKHTLSNIDKSINSVFNDVKFEDKDYELVNSLRKNAAEFSIYKSNYYTEILKSKPKEERAAIIAMYERHLDVENNLATRSARSAKQWTEFERTSELYPNLEYLPSRSVEKRAEHQQYYGIIKPINDPFWDENLPPNGWNCKCRVRKTDTNITSAEVKYSKSPNGIPGNAGKEKKLFASNHPFVTAVTKEGKRNIELQFENLKPSIPYGVIDYKKKNSSINVHPFADPNDVALNYQNAKLITDQLPDTELKITPHVNKIKGRKNPEYLINGNVADLNTLSGKNVVSLLRTAIKQNCSTIVVKINSPMDSSTLIQKIRGQLKIRKKHPIKELIVIDKENSVFKVGI